MPLTTDGKVIGKKHARFLEILMLMGIFFGWNAIPIVFLNWINPTILPFPYGFINNILSIIAMFLICFLTIIIPREIICMEKTWEVNQLEEKTEKIVEKKDEKKVRMHRDPFVSAEF